MKRMRNQRDYGEKRGCQGHPLFLRRVDGRT